MLCQPALHIHTCSISMHYTYVSLFSYISRGCAESSLTVQTEPSAENIQTGTASAIHTCTVLHCTLLYSTVLYCTVLYCTVLYCTVLGGLCTYVHVVMLKFVWHRRSGHILLNLYTCLNYVLYCTWHSDP